GNSITWVITDKSTYYLASYTIYLDGAIADEKSWSAGVPIVWAVDGLGIGVHNCTLVATDGLGGIAQDTVLITVIVPPPSTPSFSMIPFIGALLVGVALTIHLKSKKRGNLVS
nr:hypothetical protein [Candidatus Sigynarchaeota archaeon]